MKYYIALDIGGTKIAGAVVLPTGRIITRTKVSTPKKVKAKVIYQCLLEIVDDLLVSGGVPRGDCQGIGLGVPGIVDTDKNHILAAPNIDLTGFPLSVNLRRRYHTLVAMTNDVNAGLLGEAWLGSAKGLIHVLAIAPGTGVGGAAMMDGRILLGHQGAATEFGHMVMDVNGPLCHCGNHGCLESLASRWAIERDIRALIKSGRRSCVAQINEGHLNQIKSRVLKEALAAHDPVVTRVMTRVALILGKACISLNHIFNPQAIVFGGGVMKACGPFLLPLITQQVRQDPFYKSFNTCQIRQSQLGDDAVLLGAARLVMTR